MGSIIDYARRLIGTAIGFTVFGVGGLVQALVLFPLIALFSRDEETRTRRVRALISRSFRAFIWFIQALGVMELDMDPGARQKLSACGGMIVVANHPTLIDVIVLLAQIEHGNCIVKKAAWNNLFLAGVVRAANYVSNDDAEELLASCTEALERGETLLIFPEATRTVPGQAMKVYRGAARVALAARALVQFVHLDCTPPTLSKSDRWYEIPARRFCFRMAVGDTLDAADFLLAGEHQSLASRRLTQVMRRTLIDAES
jgi:1-acyl-sn-glycerol-3-phosphate acyltransferase